MTKMTTVVLPGLGSPQSDKYRPVYEYLDTEITKRGGSPDCLMYEANGHLSRGEIRGEIALPDVADFVARRLSQGNSPIELICRSFGCFVGTYVAAHYPHIA